jgi:hypothetical protein
VEIQIIEENRGLVESDDVVRAHGGCQGMSTLDIQIRPSASAKVNIHPSLIVVQTRCSLYIHDLQPAHTAYHTSYTKRAALLQSSHLSILTMPYKNNYELWVCQPYPSFDEFF